MENPLWGALADNPIIVKHMRSRLRRAQVVPAIIVILCLCGVFSYLGTITAGALGGFFYTLSFIAMLVLVIGGANQVAMAVGMAKESGILDFHRISPLPPSTVALGFFFGAPIREYVLFAVMVPFLIFTGIMAGMSFLGFIDFFVPLFTTTWLIHSIAIYVALVSKKPRMASVGVIVLTMISLWAGSIGLAGLAMARGPNAPMINLNQIDFFGIPLPRTVFLALYEGTATIFFLIAATRKMRTDRALSFAKWEALVCMASIVALALGAFWRANSVPFIVPTLLYVFVVAGIVLCGTMTPNLGEYLKGVRRARRLEHHRAPILSDSAANMWAVFGLSAWVLVGASIAWEAIEMVQPNGGFLPAGIQNGRLAYSQTIAVGVLTVAYYGLGLQYFSLKFGKKGETYFRLFLFLIWVMPVLLGIVVLTAVASPQAAQMLMGVSPWAGMILSINGGPAANAAAADAVRFMALLPSVVFAFGFHYLVMLQQRRIDRDLAIATPRTVLKQPVLV